MGEPRKSKLTDYLIEALAKSHTEEGRQELLEASAILDAEARRKLSKRPQRPGKPPRHRLRTARSPLEVRPERRIDPDLPRRPVRQGGSGAGLWPAEGRPINRTNRYGFQSEPG